MSNNGRVAPAAFPPPVDSPQEFIKRELDGEDERIEVGVAIIGGGTAGLACANRLLQLLGEDAEMMERLGEVPVAFIIGDATDDQLMDVCRDNLVPYKIPVAFQRVPAIPRSEVGKVLRRQLAETWGKTVDQ